MVFPFAGHGTGEPEHQATIPEAGQLVSLIGGGVLTLSSLRACMETLQLIDF
jgi:hypothetical protein